MGKNFDGLGILKREVGRKTKEMMEECDGRSTGIQIIPSNFTG